MVTKEFFLHYQLIALVKHIGWMKLTETINSLEKNFDTCVPRLVSTVGRYSDTHLFVRAEMNDKNKKKSTT